MPRSLASSLGCISRLEGAMSRKLDELFLQRGNIVHFLIEDRVARRRLGHDIGREAGVARAFVAETLAAPN